MLFGSGADDHVQMIIPDYVSARPAGVRTPRGRTAVPRPPRMATQGVIGERADPNAKLGERGPSLQPFRGRLARCSRGESDFQHFWRHFLPRIFCRVPCVGFQLYGKGFYSGDGTL